MRAAGAERRDAVRRGAWRALPIAAIVLLQLVVVYSLALGLRSELSAEFKTNAQETLDALAEGTIDRTQRLLRPVRNAVGVGVELMDRGVLDGADDAALETYFTAELAVTPWLSGVFLGREDGSFVYVARNEFGLRTKRITFPDGERRVELVQRDLGGAVTERWLDADDAYDPRERQWYRLALASETIAWTDPYRFFSSGLPGISVAARTKGGPILGADVELQQLSAFIARIPHAERGTALIVDGGLSVIARSRAEGLRSDVPSDTIPVLAEVAEPPLVALYAASADDRSGKTLVELEADGQTFLGLARAFPIADDAPSWTLLAQVQANDYAGGALNFFDRQIVLLGLISLALGLAALGGVLWLYRASSRSGDDTHRDPTTGVLTAARLAELQQARTRSRDGARDTVRRGVMIVEAHGLGRLADRLGRGCRDAVLVEIARRLDGVLDDADLVGISPTGRFHVALEAEHRSSLLERFDHVHRGVANGDAFVTPSGARELVIASGAAVLEDDEPIENLLPRAREALALGIETGQPGCQLAAGLAGHRLERSGTAPRPPVSPSS